MNTFKVQFFSPDSCVSFDETLSILVNGSEGKLMILANHAPYLIYALSGVVIVKLNNQGEEKIVIDNGILKVAGNNCSIFTSAFIYRAID
ncbi:F0F1 ATP synthase subunit epsilon [Wolbachia endosymbiont of Chironomus riparius]|uniref:F0F1 ATP synthase subunit epsilon n=1 Tax=Wolbachia endosymbiont of Chironomus riparius TaxID=2883238 RepID=UPI0020A109CC|nr:F0F1 ATP synthase subunit epsilon [Wolbachia endosymbiont of Chironomus riparius]